MALETGTYISDLVATNPLGSDPKSTSDDHHRLIKSTIKATFPNITGAMTMTHTELNTVTSRGLITGQTWTGTHTFPDTTYGVTAALGDSSTKFATTAFVAGTAFSSSLPAQTGANGKLLTSDGSAASWTAVKTVNSTSIIGSGDIVIPSGLTLLATLTPTAAANVDFLTTFTSAYDNYLILGEGLLPNAAERLVMRCAVAGVVDGSNLYPSLQDTGQTTTQYAFYFLQTSNTHPTGTGANFAMVVKNVNSTNSAKSFNSQFEAQSNSTPEWTFMDRGGIYNSINAVTGVRFFWESGTTFKAQGKIRVYGYQNQ